MKSGETLVDLYRGDMFVLAFVPIGRLYSLAAGDGVRASDGQKSHPARIERIETVTDSLPPEFQSSFRSVDRSSCSAWCSTSRRLPIQAKVRVTGSWSPQALVSRGRDVVVAAGETVTPAGSASALRRSPPSNSRTDGGARQGLAARFYTIYKVADPTLMIARRRRQTMSANIFRGLIPALMTPCSASGAPDFDALARKGRELVDLGMSAVVYCGSMGDCPLLADEQRMEGVERLTKAGVPVVVGTGAQSTKRAAALAAHAKKAGAGGLMVIPRLLSRGTSPAAQRVHFEAVLEAAGGLPAVIYNSPYYGFETKADLLRAQREASASRRLQGVRRCEGPLLRGRAHHGPRSLADPHGRRRYADGARLRQLRRARRHHRRRQRPAARGCILARLCEQAAAGDPDARRKAEELDRALMVLSTFDEGPDLVLFYKRLMVLEGNPEYEHHFNEATGFRRARTPTSSASMPCSSAGTLPGRRRPERKRDLPSFDRIHVVADILRDAARTEIMPRFRNLGDNGVRQKKSAIDVVTEADEAAERRITAALRKAFPAP